MPTLFELWAGTSPQWEKRYGETVINRLATYGEGANQNTNARGKDFGAGYEIFILAFFLGLYANETRALVERIGAKTKPRTVNVMTACNAICLQRLWHERTSI